MLAVFGALLVLPPVAAALMFAACVIGRRGVQVACSFTVTALVLVWSAAWVAG